MWRPICAACEKPVDQVKRYHDILAQRTTYRVVCHGRAEEFHITVEELEGACSKELRIDKSYRAFKSEAKRLPPMRKQERVLNMDETEKRKQKLIDEMTDCIRGWVYTDSLVSLDREKLRAAVAADFEKCTVRLSTGDDLRCDCAVLVCQHADDEYAKTLRQLYLKTTTFLVKEIWT